MMHKAPGPFGPLGFVSYDRGSIDHSPSCSGFRSYQGVNPPSVVDSSFSTAHPYYAPTLSSSTPYHHLGSIGFRPMPQQTHFADPQTFVDYRYYSNQPPTLAPTYENTRYSHMFDATTQPFRSSHLPQGPSASSSTFLVDHHPGPRPGPATTDTGPAPATFSSHLINPSYSPDGADSLARVMTSSPTRRHSNNVLRSPDVEKIVHHQSSSSCYTSSGNDVSSPEVTSRQPTTTKRKKRAMAVPEEQKDGQYWARRRKNNESAKKSRETRRVKAALAEKRMKGLEEEVERKRTVWKMLHKELKELKSLPSSSSSVW